MRDCSNRERLVKQWHEAILTFAHCVSQLGVRNGNGDGFQKKYLATELARLHVEDARTMLNLHRTEHGCSDARTAPQGVSRSRSIRDVIRRKSKGRMQFKPRQLEIALLVADGWSTKEIADRLGITTRTVDSHRNNIYKAVGVKNTALLVRYLMREGLLEP